MTQALLQHAAAGAGAAGAAGYRAASAAGSGTLVQQQVQLCESLSH
jgi:hypothetical protein